MTEPTAAELAEIEAFVARHGLAAEDPTPELTADELAVVAAVRAVRTKLGVT